MRKIAYLFLTLFASAILILQAGCAADQCGKAGLTCSEGKACSFEPESKTLVCLPTCVGNNDCPSEQKCHVADAKASTGVCKPACTADEDCDREGSMACDEGVCGAKSSTEICKEDADCKGGETCKDKKCESASIVGCKVVSDCKGGEECKSGKCVKVAKVADCKVITDCKGGQTCKDGKCVSISSGCTYNSDCNAGKLCHDGVCSVQCDAATDQCSAGYACIAGTCKIGCAKDADCKGGETCKDNTCKTTSTGCESTGCPTGQSCTNGQCVAPSGDCVVKATKVASGWKIELLGAKFSDFRITSLRCETKGFRRDGIEGANVNVSNGVGVCPNNMPMIHLVRGSDWPTLPANCKLVGVVRHNKVSPDPDNEGSFSWLEAIGKQCFASFVFSTLAPSPPEIISILLGVRGFCFFMVV